MKRNQLKCVIFVSNQFNVIMVMTIKKGASEKSILRILKKLQEKSKKGIDMKKYTGKIKLKKDALEIQKELRDEWN